MYRMCHTLEQRAERKQMTGPACNLKYDLDTGRMYETTMEEL